MIAAELVNRVMLTGLASTGLLSVFAAALAGPAPRWA